MQKKEKNERKKSVFMLFFIIKICLKKRKNFILLQSYTFILSMQKVDNFMKKHKKNVCLWIKSRFFVGFLCLMCKSYPHLSFSYALIHRKKAKIKRKKRRVEKVIHNKKPLKQSGLAIFY